MKKYLLPMLLQFALLWLPATALAAAPDVITTIHPLHSLVSSVMQGVAEPVLLLKGAVSPHDYRLRPSDMRTLSQPEVVFWIGPGFETFLARPLAQTQTIKSIVLAQAPGIELLSLRGSPRARGSGRSHPPLRGPPRGAKMPASAWMVSQE
jgi:zinc transport system substrate-binding protein